VMHPVGALRAAILLKLKRQAKDRWDEQRFRRIEQGRSRREMGERCGSGRLCGWAGNGGLKRAAKELEFRMGCVGLACSVGLGKPGPCRR
jgi:hypothetical protein